MSNASLPGRGSHKTKSINVEANLLTERLFERTRVSDISRKRLMLIGAGVLLFSLGVPPLFRYQQSAAKRVAEAQAVVSKTSERLAALQTMVEEAQPKLDESELMVTLRSQSKGTVGQLAGLLNAAPSGVAVSGVKLELGGAVLDFLCSADAESFEQARAFLANVKASPDSKDAYLSAARISGQLGEGGVGFDLVKKVEWGL